MIKQFLISLTFIGCLFAQQNRLFWVVSDWQKVNKIADHLAERFHRIKSAYLTGVLDGRLYGYLKVWAKNNDLADSVFEETVDYLTVRELIKNLNYFYQDPLNLYIPVPAGIIIANMYAEQVPIQSIETYIDLTRRWINDLTLDLDTLNYSKLLEDKLMKHHEKQFNRFE